MKLENEPSCLGVGQEWKIYFNPKNINNCKFIIKSVIDNNVIVYLTNKGTYVLENVSYMNLLKKQGLLIRL